MNKIIIFGFLIANFFLTNFANASANYNVYIYNRSGYPVDISKGQTTCINRIDSISSSLKKFTKNPPDGANFTFEDKNTFGGSCDGAEKSVEINVNFIGSGRTQGIIKIRHLSK